jgi:hypothetical protein
LVIKELDTLCHLLENRRRWNGKAPLDYPPKV